MRDRDFLESHPQFLNTPASRKKEPPFLSRGGPCGEIQSSEPTLPRIRPGPCRFLAPATRERRPLASSEHRRLQLAAAQGIPPACRHGNRRCDENPSRPPILRLEKWRPSGLRRIESLRSTVAQYAGESCSISRIICCSVTMLSSPKSIPHSSFTKSGTTSKAARPSAHFIIFGCLGRRRAELLRFGHHAHAAQDQGGRHPSTFES